jgi:hypothetical protein
MVDDPVWYEPVSGRQGNRRFMPYGGLCEGGFGGRGGL